MTLDIPRTQKEFINYLMKERDDCVSLRDEMNFDMGGKRIDTIREKRTFFQNIAIASATLLGLASVFSSLNEAIYPPYLYIGLGFHLIVICLVVIHLRVVLDKDLEGLTAGQDRYGNIMQDNISLIETFIEQTIKENIGDASVISTFKGYQDKLLGLKSVGDLKAENKQLDESRKRRMSGEEQMEFYGEIITFAFILGASFIVLAINGQRIDSLYLTLVILFIFLFTFTDFINPIFKNIFKVLTFLRKDLRSFSRKSTSEKEL